MYVIPKLVLDGVNSSNQTCAWGFNLLLEERNLFVSAPTLRVQRRRTSLGENGNLRPLDRLGWLAQMKCRSVMQQRQLRRRHSGLRDAIQICAGGARNSQTCEGIRGGEGSHNIHALRKIACIYFLLTSWFDLLAHNGHRRSSIFINLYS